MDGIGALELLPDDDLTSVTVALGLACGRSHSSLRKKHREYFCFLLRVLLAEHDRRRKPRPGPPFRA